MIFQAIAWSDIFISESDMLCILRQRRTFAKRDIIFALKLGVAEYHTAKPYITA